MIADLPAPARGAFGAVLALVCIFLVAPMLIVIATSFTGADYIAFPPTGLSLRWYGELFADDDFMGSLLVSLQVAAAAALVSTVLGTAASVALMRGRLPGLGVVRALLLAPLALPGLVIGVALLLTASAAGLAPAIGTMIAGHILITMPYVIRLTSAALLGFDRRIEQAAVNLGSTGLGAFLRVTLPNILPGVLGGALLAFIVSFEDVNVALFLSSPDVTTLPVRIFNLLTQESNPIGSAAGSLLTLIVVALALITDRLFGLDRAVS